uniref:Putative hydrolase-like protein n=1 Tax=Angomonas deanei TaxID=59799 RepID=C6K3Q9_9TRYP|nr:putative hydrolase-like protein [Angomonas deanei]
MDSTSTSNSTGHAEAKPRPPAFDVHPASSTSTHVPSHSAGQTKKKPHLKHVPHTPQMVVKVRDCPSSQMPIELCYQCFGDPKDGLPPVLLICGLNMQLYAWDEEFCEALVRAGFFVIRYDNRDMGHSTKVERRGRVKAPLLLLPGGAATWLGEKLPYSVEDMAADAWALLDALHIPCAHLFGISMGGMIAQTAALLAPERTISLTSVMSSTNAPDLPQPQLWVKLWMLRKPPRNCTVEELLEFRVNSLRRLLRSALPPDGEFLKKRFLMSLKRSSYSAGLVRQAATIRRAVGRDAALQRLCVPALVVHGAQDVVVPPMHGYRTATMLPYARMLVLKSMGHYFHPAFYRTIVEAFADMAASTDPTKRGLGSRLPSANCLPLGDDEGGIGLTGAEDGSASATAAWRRGGGSVSSPHTNKLDAEHHHFSTHADPAQREGTTITEKVDGSEMARDTQQTAEAPEADGDDDEASMVDPKTLMMASMGAFIQPVVADAASPVGAAVCRSVMVAVPGGNSNPGVPEAVILEKMFLRNPHATPSVPVPTIVRKPAPPPPPPRSPSSKTPAASPTSNSAASTAAFKTGNNSTNNNSNNNSSTSNSTSSCSPAVSGNGGSSKIETKGGPATSVTPPPPPAAAAAAATSRVGSGTHGGGDVASSPLLTSPSKPTMDGGAPATLPRPLPMDGAVPYVPCSPSCWHEAAPFPLRSTKDKTATSAAPSSYPRFHPQVVGVPLEAYLDTHPMERETSGLAILASASGSLANSMALSNNSPHNNNSNNSGSSSGAKQGKEQQAGKESFSAATATATATAFAPSAHEKDKSSKGGSAQATQLSPHTHARSINEASWLSATAVHDATTTELVAVGHPASAEGKEEDLTAREASNYTLSGAGVGGQRKSPGSPSASSSSSSSSTASSEERRENESFLQCQAPAEVVEASALPSL